MRNLLLLLSVVVFVVGLLAPINGVGRSSTTTHATVSPASSPQPPPAHILPKGSATFGFILLGFAIVALGYWWASFFWSLIVIEDRPRVVVRAATRGVLDCFPIFIAILKLYIAAYLTVKMFWPAMRVIDAHRVPPWENIWEPV